MKRCRPGRGSDELAAYPEAFRASWLYDELHRARNFKPWMSKGLYTGSLMVGVDQVLFRGKAPWTLSHNVPDHLKTRPASEFSPIAYPKPDGVLTFDRLSSVFVSNTNHNEDQPVHLTLKDPSIPVKVNLAEYAGPESRYLPRRGLRVRREEAGDQRAELRALQDLRHQGSDAEHRLGRAGRRRRPELPEHVAQLTQSLDDRLDQMLTMRRGARGLPLQRKQPRQVFDAFEGFFVDTVVLRAMVSACAAASCAGGPAGRPASRGVRRSPRPALSAGSAARPAR
jgi:hypothetical protein